MDPEFLKQLLTALFAPRQAAAPQGNSIQDIVRATDPDPVGTANKLSNLPSSAPGSLSPFATGFFNPENSAASMSPEARLASQGRSATNQWAALGANSAIDPAKLQQLNQAKVAAGMNSGAPPRNDFGPVQGPDVTVSDWNPQVGSWMGSPATGWELVGPAQPGQGGGNILGSIPMGPVSPNETPFGIMNPKQKRRPFKAGVGVGNGLSAGAASSFNY